MSAEHPSYMSRRGLFRHVGAGTAAIALGGLLLPLRAASAEEHTARDSGTAAVKKGKPVVGDPTALPGPIHRSHSVHHDIKLTVDEHYAEISPGALFRFCTFDGHIPGPMIRVREGDTVSFTLENPTGNLLMHNVDMHAVYGSGGGAPATLVAPGQSKTEHFRAMYPGAFIYHCAVVPNMDMHISSGMYGMILVEPKDGLPRVDREFYLGQNEVYTDKRFGAEGVHQFDWQRLAAEDPTYVLFNGGAAALTPRRAGAMKAKVGETVRVFMVNGGPNLTSSFHPIGNVWTEAWSQGAIANEPQRYIQTQSVPPGSTFVGHMKLPVPETVKLVDHALTRVMRKGLLAEINVEGAANPDIFRS
ncbi:MAG: copper-containing nitrite reductase [Gammaproteobacteria bacterium]|jgi:nitrite reductase (NO-forming)